MLFLQKAVQRYCFFPNWQNFFEKSFSQGKFTATIKAKVTIEVIKENEKVQQWQARASASPNTIGGKPQ